MLDPMIIESFKRIGVDECDLLPGSLLESDLGMDSQEIVSLRCVLEKLFSVKLPPGFIQKSESIQSVQERLFGFIQSSRRQPMVLSSSTLKNSIEEEELIDAPLSRVYMALHRFQDWPKHLPHVTRVEALYDDGEYQEFRMDVQAESGGLLKVRSIRRCLKDSISFFQPEPPAFLLHHAGLWSFKEVSINKTYVSTQHRWDLNLPIAREVFDIDDSKMIEERVKKLLTDHANQALGTWKEVLEEEAL